MHLIDICKTIYSALVLFEQANRIDSLHKFLLYILYTITNRKIAFSGTKFHNPYMVFTTDVFIKFDCVIYACMQLIQTFEHF